MPTVIAYCHLLLEQILAVCQVINYQENLDQVSAMLWLMNLSDGGNDLISVAERSGCDIRLLHHFAKVFCEMGLLKEKNDG